MIGVKGNDRAYRLAGKATLISGLLLRRPEVLRSSRHYLWAQSRGHHTINRLEERDVKTGSQRWSSMKVRERAIINQMNTGTVSKATLGKLLRDGVECIYGLFWACTYHFEVELSWTDLNYFCTHKTRCHTCPKCYPFGQSSPHAIKYNGNYPKWFSFQLILKLNVLLTKKKKKDVSASFYDILFLGLISLILSPALKNIVSYKLYKLYF